MLFDASTRLRADLVATNERISELGGASPDQISSSDLALATLMADREVTLDLLVELDTRADQLSDLAPASVIGVDTPIASSPNI